MKKTINLPDKLHQAVKVQSAKVGMTMEAYIAKALWANLGTPIVPSQRKYDIGY